MATCSSLAGVAGQQCPSTGFSGHGSSTATPLGAVCSYTCSKLVFTPKFYTSPHCTMRDTFQYDVDMQYGGTQLEMTSATEFWEVSVGS